MVRVVDCLTTVLVSCFKLPHCDAELLRKAAADLQTLQAAHQALHASHADAERTLAAAGAAAEQVAAEKEALLQQLTAAAAEKV